MNTFQRYMSLLSISIAMMFKLNAAEVSIDNQWVEIEDSMLRVNFRIIMPSIELRGNQTMVFTPMVITAEKSERLPQVVLGRRAALLAYQRRVDPLYGRPSVRRPYQMVRISRDGWQQVDYCVTTQYQSWMDSATIDLYSTLQQCLNNPRDKFVANIYSRHIHEVASEPINYESSLLFEFDSSRFNSERERNREVVSRVDELINSGAVVKITLVGYASPIGSDEYNRQLSRERVYAVMNYFVDRYGASTPAIEMSWMGDDWSEERGAVSEDRYPMLQCVEITLTTQ